LQEGPGFAVFKYVYPDQTLQIPLQNPVRKPVGKPQKRGRTGMERTGGVFRVPNLLLRPLEVDSGSEQTKERHGGTQARDYEEENAPAQILDQVACHGACGNLPRKLTLRECNSSANLTKFLAMKPVGASQKTACYENATAEIIDQVGRHGACENAQQDPMLKECTSAEPKACPTGLKPV
jgi:hypothetical protein